MLTRWRTRAKRYCCALQSRCTPLKETLDALVKKPLAELSPDELLESIVTVTEERNDTQESFKDLLEIHTEMEKLAQASPTDKAALSQFQEEFPYPSAMRMADTVTTRAEQTLRDLYAEATRRGIEVPSMEEESTQPSAPTSVHSVARPSTAPPPPPKLEQPPSTDSPPANKETAPVVDHKELPPTLAQPPLTLGLSPPHSLEKPSRITELSPHKEVGPAPHSEMAIVAATIPSAPRHPQEHLQPSQIRRMVINTPIIDTTRPPAATSAMAPPPAHDVLYVPAPSTATTAFTSSLQSRIPMPAFAGDIAKWPEFDSAFHGLVGSHDIDPALKLELLRSCLQGEAREMIEGLTIIDSNFETAMIILKKEYDRPHLVQQTLLSKMHLLPPCGDDPRKLYSLYVKLNSIIHQLLPCGDLDAPELLVNTILLMLPPDLQTRIVSELPFKKYGIYDILSTKDQNHCDLHHRQELLPMSTTTSPPLRSSRIPCPPRIPDDSTAVRLRIQRHGSRRPTQLPCP